ncbi:MAG: beta strand repeat-containing protein, partial [Bdellovibrionales bacterium]
LPTVSVVPGALSLAQTQISIDGSPTTVGSGSGVTLRLRARDSAGNFILSGGSTVVFTYGGGTSTGTIGGTSDLGNGQYSADFTGAAAGTAVSISATVGGSSVTSISPQIQVIPGAPSVANSTITVANGSVQSGLNVGVTLTTRDAFGNLITVGGQTVTFNNSGGSSTGSFGSVTDNSNGTYTANFTGIVSGTPTNIGGSIGGVAITSSLPQITVIPGPANVATSLVTVSSGSVISGNNVTLTLTTYDAGGNAVTTGGSTVVFSRSGGTSTGNISATTDNNNGTYSATFTGVVSGSATTIRATIGGALVSTASPTITVNPGSISAANSVISLSSSSVNSGSNVTLTLTARDLNNNLVPTGGATVVFNRSGGTSTGNISATSDSGTGNYTATFTGVVSGTPTTIGGTINGTPVSTTLPTLTVNPGPMSLANSLISVSSGTINSGSNSTLTLTGIDAAGNFLTAGGATVVFSYSGGTSTGTIGSTTDNGNGTYSASFTGLLSGTPTTIGATVGGSAITSTLPTILVNPGPASLANSLLTVSSGSLLSGALSNLTLTVRDAAGNQQSVGGRTVVFSNTGGSSTGNITATTDNNNGTYTAT